MTLERHGLTEIEVPLPEDMARMLSQPLTLMLRGLPEAAGRAWHCLATAYGLDGISTALQMWCDALGDALNLPFGGVDALHVSYRTADARAGTANDVDAHYAWAGRILAARLTNDPEQFAALMRAVPHAEINFYAAALLDLVADNLRATWAGTPPTVQTHGRTSTLEAYIDDI